VQSNDIRVLGKEEVKSENMKDEEG